MFKNYQLDELPLHQKIIFKPLAANALLHTQLSWLLFYLPLVAILAAICFFNETFAETAQTGLIIGLPIILFLSISYNVLNVRCKGFAMREHDIAYRKGVIWQQETVLPLARIQHTEIHQGPLERALDLANLRLYSAGGMSADLNISGLSHDECKNIRQFVQKYTEARQASVKQTEAHTHNESLHEES